jgi:hypothetical protein
MPQAALLPSPFPAWCAIEIHGLHGYPHMATIYGLASEQSVAGQLFLRVDTLADRDWPAFTVLLAPSQIKMITPLTDEQVSERKRR